MKMLLIVAVGNESNYMFYNIWMIFWSWKWFQSKASKILHCFRWEQFHQKLPNYWNVLPFFLGGSFCFVLVASRTSIHSDGWFVRWTVWRLEAAWLLAVQTMGKRWELKSPHNNEAFCELYAIELKMFVEFPTQPRLLNQVVQNNMLTEEVV